MVGISAGIDSTRLDFINCPEIGFPIKWSRRVQGKNCALIIASGGRPSPSDARRPPPKLFRD